MFQSIKDGGITSVFLPTVSTDDNNYAAIFLPYFTVWFSLDLFPVCIFYVASTAIFRGI